MANDLPELLKKKMDEYAYFVYRLMRDFPKEKIYGVTSQLRRSVLLAALNYIEGFAKQKKAVKNNFWETACGSPKESK